MRYIDQRTLEIAQQTEAGPGQAASTSRMAGIEQSETLRKLQSIVEEEAARSEASQPAGRRTMTINRIVVTLRPTFDGGTQVKLDKATVNFPQGQLAAPFVCQTPTTTTWTAPNAVMQHGRDLRQALAQHPAIAQMLQMLTPATQVTPIYFNFQKVADAEQLYWEALYDDAQGIFLALDLRWPIGRIADALATQPAQTFYKFDGRLRMAAVLSALDAPAAVEWQNLRQAIDAARTQGLPVDVLLLVGEESLHDDVHAELAGGALSGVTVKSLADTVDETRNRAR